MEDEVKWYKSLLVKVNGSIILILIIFMLILGLVVNNLVSKEITNQVEEKNLEIASSLQQNANDFLNQTEGVIKLTSRFDKIKSENKQDVLEMVRKVKEENPHFKYVYLATTEGEMIIYPQADLGSDFDPTTRPWYQKAMQEDGLIWTDVFTDAGSGDSIITTAIPVEDIQGQLIGVLAGDVSLEKLSQAVASRKIGKTGYAYMTNNKGEIIAHPDSSLVKESYNINQDLDFESVLEKEKGSIEYQDIDTQKNKLASYVSVDRINGTIFAQIESQEAYAVKNELQLIIFGMSLLVLIIVGTAVYFVNKKYLLNPINELVELISKVAQGDLDRKVDNVKEDEIGQIQSALNTMITNLHDIVENILDTTENLSAYSEELAASSEEGNATIETTNNLIENMSASIQQISASAQEVTSFAQESNSQTEVGRKKIEQTMNNMKEINQAVDETVTIINDLDNTSEEIGQIVEMITNIAEQTNLLALNAAIEAARAGEHGQGFAVVAEEIRDLAEDTADATDKIANLINKTQEKSDAGIEAIKEVKNKAENGQEIVQETGQVFAEIEEATEETSAQIEQTASSTQDLAQNSEEIKEASEGIEQMSDEVTESSQELSVMAQELQEIVNKFKV
ncbi:methyl-accepting chemotaxis protein [Halanaerobacter jeridensis]|uniref:Methyl-accepting chemotaxis protein n=1 Tax=Halanaerobacter jeridensis TaxID=706427 RepID=A0A938XV39_9FIRM|nr:methyl-accepting chemotaxis protein [Halanaerobacter jeridensis]MBM7555795.1 methyl-accepting chemotaxis protein [Halanaerobacter jeridensis]